MTESAASTAGARAGSFVAEAESFVGVIWRRLRYVVAIVISSLVFYYVGWHVGAPLADVAGVSLLAWSGGGGGLAAALGLGALLVGLAVVCMLIVHPDHPHMGLLCALAGMMALAGRAGSVHMLIAYGQQGGVPHYANLMEILALESVQWTILFLVAELVVRMVHDRFFANTRWITRSGPGLEEEAVKSFAATRKAMGVSLAVSQSLRTTTMRRRIATPLGMIYSGVVAFILLYVLLQSEEKGQVFFACALAFFLSTANAYLAFPRVPALAYFLAVPLTAAVGYFLGRGDPGVFPGYPGMFMARALPIDFIAAGVPGAILGYYAAIRWSLHSEEGE